MQPTSAARKLPSTHAMMRRSTKWATIESAFHGEGLSFQFSDGAFLREDHDMIAGANLCTSIRNQYLAIRARNGTNFAACREIELSRRHGSVMSVILLDIDHFKRINDRFGHLAGDQALRAVAQCAERTIRESDMLFRYGGEEFLILLSGTDADGACLLAERIRQNVASIDSKPGSRLRLTVSLGVTSLTAEDTPSSLFERADAALYRAKQEGRDQVAVD